LLSAPTRHFSDMDCTWACSLESTANVRQRTAKHGKAPCTNGRRSYTAVKKSWAELHRREKILGRVTPPWKNLGQSYTAVKKSWAELRRRAKMDTPSQPPKDGKWLLSCSTWAVRSQRQVFSTAGGQNHNFVWWIVRLPNCRFHLQHPKINYSLASFSFWGGSGYLWSVLFSRSTAWASGNQKITNSSFVVHIPSPFNSQMIVLIFCLSTRPKNLSRV
jgi:hypothetical protein